MLGLASGLAPMGSGLVLFLLVTIYCFWRGASFYGWVIVSLSFVFLGLAYTVWYSFAVFQVALFEEFGWARGDTALAYSILAISHALSGPITGALADRFGVRRMIPAGAVLTALGLAACSQLNSLWQLYIFFGIITALGTSVMGWIPHTTLLNNWFLRERGTAIGIASAGIGLGIFALVPLTQLLIDRVGWRGAYLAYALTIFLGVFLPALLLVRSHPQEMGLVADGVDTSREARKEGPKTGVAEDPLIVDKSWVSRDWTIGKALLTPRFWLLALAFFLGNVFAQTFLVHQVAYLVGRGYDRMFAASIAGLVGLSSAIGKVFFGAISDRIGREWSWTFGMAFSILGIVAVVLAGSPSLVWLAYGYSFFYGMGYGSTVPLTPTMAADVFQGRGLSTIYGTIQIGTGLGAAFGGWFGGFVYDLTRSYLMAFAAAFVAAVLSVVAVWLVAPRKVRRVAGQVAGQREPRPEAGSPDTIGGSP